MTYLLEVVNALRLVWDSLGAHSLAGVPVSYLLMGIFFFGVVIRFLKRVFK